MTSNGDLAAVGGAVGGDLWSDGAHEGAEAPESHLALAAALGMFRRAELDQWQSELLQLRQMTIGFQ